MICVSLSGLSFQECLVAISQSEYAEIRMDLLNLSRGEYTDLFAMKNTLIATCRPANFTTAERLEKLKSAMDAGAGFIDIEYEAESAYRLELMIYAHKKNVEVIISYQNYEGTPPAKDLDGIIRNSRNMGADIIKITTTSQGKDDNAIILSLYERHEHLIAFCMGKPGKITRIAAPLLGAKFTYAAWSKQLATAPGQITKETLRKIYELMES